MVNAVDKEQIEMLSNWWNDYGKGILIAIVIGLLIGLGWRYWISHKQTHKMNAVAVFEQYYANSFTHNTAQAAQDLKQLQQSFNDTPYATIASLFAASNYVAANDNSQALAVLQWAVDHGAPNSFKQIARIRAARLLIAMKKYPEALTMLDTVLVSSYAPLVASTRGDVYLAQGNEAEAKKAYEQAKTAYTENQLNNPLLDMRLTSLESKIK